MFKAVKYKNYQMFIFKCHFLIIGHDEADKRVFIKI